MTMSQRMWMREQERKKRERLKRAKRRRNCTIIVFILAVVAVVCVVFAMSGNKDEQVGTNIDAEYTQSPDIDKSTADKHYTTTRTVEDIKLSFYNNSAFAGNALAETIGMYGILENSDFYTNVNADLENVYTLTTIGSTASIVEQFKSKNFKKIFLAFGENELSSGNSAEFKTNYKTLIEKIKEYQPNVSIYIISIPPVTAETSEIGNNGITMSRIKSYNDRIKAIAVEEDIYFIDSVDALGDNKDFLPQGVSNDGVNLNKAAVVDLLYYAACEAYIPTHEDLKTNKEDEEETETESPVTEDDTDIEVTQKPETKDAEPESTVNVLKSSEIKKKEE